MYDNAGNIIRKVSTSTSTSSVTNTQFTYSDSDWGDLLIGVNNATITYDNIGNPIRYYNGFIFTWQGRLLTRASSSAGTYNFAYNDEGLRVIKSKSGLTIRYSYDGSLLVKEESPQYTIIYLYDANGSPVGFKYRLRSYAENVWDQYFYEKNLQGDIVAVYNASGTKLISYKYNAWGEFTVTYHNGGANTTAVNNPFKYRGYYYDADLGLYYLQSRYYDPNTCRFINADDISVIGATPSSLTDKNLFSYCDNNPVMRVDHGGHFWGTVFDVISLGISIVDVINNPDDVWAWIGLAGDVVDLLPIVSGVGEATDLLRIANKADNFINVAGTVHDTLKITDGSIDTYKNLKKINKGNGLEVHHIVEKRFAGVLNIKQNDMLSVALTHDEHLKFTKEWRRLLPYGHSYKIPDIWKAAQKIYANHPSLLKAVEKTLRG